MNPTLRPDFAIVRDPGTGAAHITEPMGDGELRLDALAEWLLWQCDGRHSLEALHARLCAERADPPTLTEMRTALDELEALGLLAPAA